MLVKKKIVVTWMIIGLFMIFFQIIIGGVTRLTGSGLSITKWEIVTGAIPPLSQEGWELEFELYKKTPQYEKLNRGMSLTAFKQIYFWEYLHRLWARWMGFVFIIPFAYFSYRKWISRKILLRLMVVFFLAALAGLFGWIMVASGLVERPWVNAYKLAIHLCLAMALFGYLLWTILLCKSPGKKEISNSRVVTQLFASLLGFQIFLGGIMAGTRAAVSSPSWPKINGKFLPDVLLEGKSWTVENFVNYDNGHFFVSLIQFCHRGVAYVLIIIGLALGYRLLRKENNNNIRIGVWVLITVLVLQSVLGIVVLISSIGAVPVFWGVVHQGVAFMLLGVALYICYLQTFKTAVKY